ncbi:N-acetyl-gamma-glutamyl-phosphate reductase [Acetomicrobium hydrogeniformans]|uniref:N-acetyl-gamma-glutamyl-phosphate reductase n=1 Tax=Acetomicrobium hydrogeniformans TaxID=649746 RepID=A0A7V7BYR8_9BACT|nr:N-acetyl-gamma-glutamyl-phosphate reductase [Acetomicrobium hydrogeniformans]HHZ04905.1 N-acetyl-gamma-glutamyl-phosphate reductase [Acetomicrobium hydrogeniformans]
MQMTFKAAVWGASGMAGGEVLRILARHSNIRVECAVSKSKNGQFIWQTHPHLRDEYGDLTFCDHDEAFLKEADIVFLAVPHGTAVPVIEKYLEKGTKVVDLSADVRLSSSGDYEKWYGSPHPNPDLLTRAVYGLPELHGKEIEGVNLASGVGCNAACCILGLFPLAREGLIEEVRIEVRVGSSEAGATPTVGSHHPYRSRTLRVYEPFRHRHLAEILQELSLEEDAVTMTMTAVEIVRGAQMLAHIRLSEKVREGEIWKLYKNAYKDKPFLQLCPAKPAHLRLPEPKMVTGSNQAMTGFTLHEDGRRMLVVTAIDNLMKGAAGTAVQASNLMLGLNETEGLTMMPVYPV